MHSIVAYAPNCDLDVRLKMMDKKRKRLLIAVGIPAALLAVFLSWQLVTYIRVSGETRVGFGNFLAIRLLILIEEGPRVPRNLRIMGIRVEEAGVVRVTTGEQWGPLAGRGKMFVLKKNGFWWTILKHNMWMSQKGPKPNKQMQSVCRVATQNSDLSRWDLR